MSDTCDLYLQTEQIRYEGVWHYVQCKRHPGRSSLCVISQSEEESAFVGRGAKAKAEKAMRLIAGERR